MALQSCSLDLVATDEAEVDRDERGLTLVLPGQLLTVSQFL
jgi:hypothetical protein